MTVSNKQRQEHDNLAATWSVDHKEDHECCQSLQFVKPRTQMQAPTRTYVIVITNFDHMIRMDENVNWIKIINLMSIY